MTHTETTKVELYEKYNPAFKQFISKIARGPVSHVIFYPTVEPLSETYTRLDIRSASALNENLTSITEEVISTHRSSIAVRPEYSTIIVDGPPWVTPLVIAIAKRRIPVIFITWFEITDKDFQYAWSLAAEATVVVPSPYHEDLHVYDEDEETVYEYPVCVFRYEINNYAVGMKRNPAMVFSIYNFKKDLFMLNGTVVRAIPRRAFLTIPEQNENDEEY